MEIDKAITALGALAQETRLALFRLLVAAGPAGLPAGAIALRLAVPPTTLSFHLNLLRHAGLIDFRRQGRTLTYAAQFPAMNALLAYLTENCCRGSDCGAECPPAQSQGEPDATPARARLGP